MCVLGLCLAEFCGQHLQISPEERNQWFFAKRSQRKMLNPLFPQNA